MSIIKTEALIIKGFRYGDSSKIITVFSREYGKFNAIVKSTRSIRSKTSGVFDNLNRISIFFNRKENRDLQFFSKGDCIDAFQSIKIDLEKLSAAYRIAEMINYSTHDYDSNEDLYELAVECLSNLDSDWCNSLAHLVYFQANLTKTLGIKPDLVEINQINASAKIETFNSVNALKLNGKECETINGFFEGKTDFTGMEEVNFHQISEKFDGYLSGHMDKSINLKIKSILHELNL